MGEKKIIEGRDSFGGYFEDFTPGDVFPAETLQGMSDGAQ